MRQYKSLQSFKKCNFYEILQCNKTLCLKKTRSLTFDSMRRNTDESVNILYMNHNFTCLTNQKQINSPSSISLTNLAQYFMAYKLFVMLEN